MIRDGVIIEKNSLRRKIILNISLSHLTIYDLMLTVFLFTVLRNLVAFKYKNQGNHKDISGNKRCQ